MYQKIKTISEPNLCKHKATLFFKTNHSAFLEHHSCAIFDFAQWETIALQGVLYTNIANCLSQSEIRMAGKIILFKFLKYMIKHIELNPVGSKQTTAILTFAKNAYEQKLLYITLMKNEKRF